MSKNSWHALETPSTNVSIEDFLVKASGNSAKILELFVLYFSVPVTETLFFSLLFGTISHRKEVISLYAQQPIGKCPKSKALELCTRNLLASCLNAGEIIFSIRQGECSVLTGLT